MNLRPIVSALELIDKSSRLLRLLWGSVVVAMLFGLAALVQAIRWW